MSGNFRLTEEQFNKIKPLLPNKPRGVPRVDDRRVISGIIFCLQRGLPLVGRSRRIRPGKDALQPLPALVGSRRV